MVGGPAEAKAGKSGAMWHFRRREDVPLDGSVVASAGSGAIAESPLGSADFVLGAVESHRGHWASWDFQEWMLLSCREMEEPCEVGVLLWECPASADAMESSLSCCRVPVLWLPMVGGKGSPLFWGAPGTGWNLSRPPPWGPLLSPGKKGHIVESVPSLSGVTAGPRRS